MTPVTHRCVPTWTKIPLSETAPLSMQAGSPCKAELESYSCLLDDQESKAEFDANASILVSLFFFFFLNDVSLSTWERELCVPDKRSPPPFVASLIFVENAISSSSQSLYKYLILQK